MWEALGYQEKCPIAQKAEEKEIKEVKGVKEAPETKCGTVMLAGAKSSSSQQR